MTKFLTLWKIDTTRIPNNPEERIKIDTIILDMVKEDLKHGLALEWGMFAGGTLAGYAICEGTEVEVTKMNLKYVPYIKMETYPIVTISQVEKMIKSL